MCPGCNVLLNTCSSETLWVVYKTRISIIFLKAARQWTHVWSDFGQFFLHIPPTLPSTRGTSYQNFWPFWLIIVLLHELRGPNFGRLLPDKTNETVTRWMMTMKYHSMIAWEHVNVLNIIRCNLGKSFTNDNRSVYFCPGTLLPYKRLTLIWTEGSMISWSIALTIALAESASSPKQVKCCTWNTIRFKTTVIVYHRKNYMSVLIRPNIREIGDWIIVLPDFSHLRYNFTMHCQWVLFFRNHFSGGSVMGRNITWCIDSLLFIAQNHETSFHWSTCTYSPVSNMTMSGSSTDGGSV